MIQTRSHQQGAILPISARAGARSNEVRGEQAGRLRVCVTQAPEKGKANKALLNVLARWLDVRRSRLSLIAGETSPRKEVLIEGIGPDELRAQLADRLD